MEICKNSGTWANVSYARRLIGPNEYGQLPRQFLRLQHDHKFVERLQPGVVEARAAIEKSALAHIEQQKLEQRARWHAIEQFLLMKSALIAVFGQARLHGTECLIGCAIAQDLLRFQRTVGIVPAQPMAYTLAERIVVEVTRELAHWSIRNGNRIDKALVAHLVRPKQAYVVRGRNHVL